MKRLAVLATCLAVFGACKKKEVKGDADAASAAPATGINAPGNDPKIVELAKKALGCKWTGNDHDTFPAFDDACPDYKAWKEEKAAFANKKGEPTLVNFIEDTDDKVRFLGEKRLGDDLGELTDPALAGRVMTVAEKITTPRDGAVIGVIVGNTKLTDPALWPRIKTLFTSSKDGNLRQEILTDLLEVNPDNADVLEWTRAVMKDTSDKRTSRTAMDAFSRMKTATPARCDAYFENIENPDPAHAGDALQWMTFPRMQCESKYDAVLKSIDARVKAKTIANSFFPSALDHLCDPKGKATPAQITAALGLAHHMAEDKTLAGNIRAYALDASFTCDPKGGKAYLGKFDKETDPDIKNRVTVLKKK